MVAWPLQARIGGKVQWIIPDLHFSFFSFFSLFFFHWRSACPHQVYSLGLNQSTMAQRFKTTVDERSLTRGGQDSSIGSVKDLWLEDHQFDTQQETFLLQSQLSALTHIRSPYHPWVTAVAGNKVGAGWLCCPGIVGAHQGNKLTSNLQGTSHFS